MRMLHKLTAGFVVITVLFATAFFCCCERVVFADSCHKPISLSQHCHQTVSENRDQGVQLFSLIASHKCNCEKIITDRNTPKLDINILSNFQLLHKIFTIAKSISPVLTFVSSSTIHGPPVPKFSSTSLYLQFSNLRL